MHWLIKNSYVTDARYCQQTIQDGDELMPALILRITLKKMNKGPKQFDFGTNAEQLKINWSDNTIRKHT